MYHDNHDAFEDEEEHEEFLRIFFIVSVTVQTLIMMIQLATSQYFFTKVKGIKEVGPVTKRLVIIGNIVSINLLIMCVVYQLKDELILPNTGFNIIVYCFWLPTTVLIFYVMAQWLRLIRVQVQLRNDKDCTIDTIRKMKTTRNLQHMWLFGFAGLQIISYFNLRFVDVGLARLILGEISSFLSWLIIVLAVIYIQLSNNQFSLFFLE